MSEKTQKAKELHKAGFNCAQAVACSFCEDLGVNAEDMFKISGGFGFGMGVMDMCGAVSGMLMVIGMKNSVGDLSKGDSTKADTYKKTRAYIEKFKEKTGSSHCNELKGKGGKAPLVSCVQCIELATELTEEFLRNECKN